MKVRDGKLSHSKKRRLAQLREEEALRAHEAANTEPKRLAEQEPRDDTVTANSALIKQEQPANPAVEVPNGSNSLNKTCRRHTVNRSPVLPWLSCLGAKEPRPDNHLSLLRLPPDKVLNGGQ
jgi:hypothetical protein